MFSRITAFVFLATLGGPPRQTPLLTISVSSEPVSASAPLRIIASSGTIVSRGQSYRASTDTLRVTGSAELTSTDPIVVATFLADEPRGRVSVEVREDGNRQASGTGEAIVVIRTPVGAQLQAMAIPAELRRKP
jgi:hypothetical protein